MGDGMEMQPHMHIDPFEEIEMSENNAEEHMRSSTEKDVFDNARIVYLRYFTLYAFAGRSGEPRWNRKNENIVSEPSAASQLIPQHNYKLDVHALNTFQPGEFECRKFRESILGVMSHHWNRQKDNLLKLVSNVIEKAVNIANSSKTKKRKSCIHTITNYMQLWWVPNVVVMHEKEGNEAVHLASGHHVSYIFKKVAFMQTLMEMTS